MDDRKQSKHMVTVVDPNLDPSVKDMLRVEQDNNPQVTSVKAMGRWGIVETSKGAYCLTDDGTGTAGIVGFLNVDFCRHIDRKDGSGSFETKPFAMARFSLAELKACATGEVVRLDEFIRKFGSRLDDNYEAWEKVLS